MTVLSESIKKAKEIAEKLEEKYGFPPPAAVVDQEVYKLRLSKDYEFYVDSLFYYFYNLPRLTFDINVYEKVVEIAKKLDVGIKDQTARKDEHGISLVLVEGEITLYDDELYIDKEIPSAEEIVDSLLEIYLKLGDRSKSPRQRPTSMIV